MVAASANDEAGQSGALERRDVPQALAKAPVAPPAGAPDVAALSSAQPPMSGLGWRPRRSRSRAHGDAARPAAAQAHAGRATPRRAG
eukprot:191343-Prymnesium_polylepis.1